MVRQFRSLPAYHLNLILVSIPLFLSWQVVEHVWLMHWPMSAYHVVSGIGSVAWLLFVVGLVFSALRRHEESLAHANAELAAKNARLEAIEQERDKRLVQLAQELSLTLVELRSVAQVSLQRTTDLNDIKAFSNAIDRADELFNIAEEILDLKQHDSWPPPRVLSAEPALAPLAPLARAA